MPLGDQASRAELERTVIALVEELSRAGLREILESAVAWQPLLSQERRHTRREAPKPVREQSALDKAYEDLDALLVRRMKEETSPELEAEIDTAWEHLRTLQKAASWGVVQQLEQSLELPPSELDRLAREAQALLDEGE